MKNDSANDDNAVDYSVVGHMERRGQTSDPLITLEGTSVTVTAKMSDIAHGFNSVVPGICTRQVLWRVRAEILSTEPVPVFTDALF